MTTTLTGLNLDAVAHLHARGFGPEQIREKLEEGVKVPEFEGMAPVVISRAAIVSRLRTDHVKKLTHKWRLQLYGDVYESELAFAGSRVKKLTWLIEHAEGTLRCCETIKESVSVRAEIRGHLAEIGRIADATQAEFTIRQEAADGTEVSATGSAQAMKALLEELGPMMALEGVGATEQAEESPEVKAE